MSHGEIKQTQMTPADHAKALMDMGYDNPLTMFCELMFQGKPLPTSYAECDEVVCDWFRRIAGGTA